MGISTKCWANGICIISHDQMSTMKFWILKINGGTLLRFIRNLNLEDKLLNGVIRIFKFLLEIYTFENTPKAFSILRVTLFTAGINGTEITWGQLPIKLAYTLTVDESQGYPLNSVDLDSRGNRFAHRQLYIGLCKARCCENVCILITRRGSIKIV